MRIIIKKDYDDVTDWAATYIAYKINSFRRKLAITLSNIVLRSVVSLFLYACILL